MKDTLKRLVFWFNNEGYLYALLLLWAVMMALWVAMAIRMYG